MRRSRVIASTVATFAVVVLTGCSTPSTDQPTRDSSAGAGSTFTGRLVKVGGPTMDLRQAVGVPGLVTLNGPGGTVTLTTGADGRFHGTLEPGTYTVTGRSSTVGGVVCRPDPAAVAVPVTVGTLAVFCHIR